MMKTATHYEELRDLNTGYMEVRHMCDDNVELTCHVEYDRSSGSLLAINPFYVQGDLYSGGDETRKYEAIRDRMELYREAVERSAIEKIRASMRNKPMYNPWIPCGVRKPTREDADPYNHVIAWDAVHRQAIIIFPEDMTTRKGLTHWKPTNLPKESPPI